MTVRVPVRGEVLTWAIERAGYVVDTFLLERPQAGKWLTGEKQPTLLQLEDFAKKLHVPFGYLMLPAPPQEEALIPLFRTIAGGTAVIPPAVRDTVLLVKQRQEWLSEYLAESGAEALPFVNSFPAAEAPLDLAMKMRELLKLPLEGALARGKTDDTLRMLTTRLEDEGIHVVFSGIVGDNTKRPIPVEQCRGFVLLDAYAPFVFVNSQDAKAAQLFTLAHEFAHVLAGQEGIVNLEQLLPADDPLERLCNAAAAEFLVPAAALLEVWEIEEDLARIARRFGVSQVVIGRRLLDMGLWDRPTFFAFYRSQQAKWQDQRQRRSEDKTPGGDYYASKALKVGRPFLHHVDTALKSGALAYDQAYRLTGTKRHTFDALLDKLNHPDG